MGIGDNSPQQGYCIYFHASRLCDNVYVGVTKNIKNRWARKEEGYRRCPKIYNAFKKYGWNNFVHVVLHDKMTKEEAFAEEKIWVAFFKLANKSYNVTDGGEGGSGVHRTEAEKEHIRKCQLGFKRTEEQKQKLRKVQQEICGKKVYAFNPETKELIKEYPSINDAARQLNTTYHTIARAVKGKKTLAKECLWSFYPNLDKHLKEAQIQYRRGKIYCYDLRGNYLREYENSKKAAKAVNGSTKAITENCNGKILSYKGFIWRKSKEGIDENILLRIQKSRKI